MRYPLLPYATLHSDASRDVLLGVPLHGLQRGSDASAAPVTWRLGGSPHRDASATGGQVM